MIRLSVTQLDSYRYFKERDDQELEDLIADLTYSRPRTWRMEAGGALASVLESAPSNIPIDLVTSQGWTFDFSDLQAELPDAPHKELKGRVLIDSPTGRVMLTGKADGVDALTIRDQKLTDRFDPERYLESLQWRSYLWMFGASRFVYEVFEGRLDEVRRTAKINAIHPVTFYAYPGIDRDVYRAVDDLAALIRRYRQTNEHLAKAFPELPDQEEP